MIGLDDPVAVSPPFAEFVKSVAVTVYPEMGEPLSEGAVNDTVAEALPPVAVTPDGAFGAATSVITTSWPDGPPR